MVSSFYKFLYVLLLSEHVLSITHLLSPLGSKPRPRMTAYIQGFFPLLSARPEVHICSVGMVAEAEQKQELVEMLPFA